MPTLVCRTCGMRFTSEGTDHECPQCGDPLAFKSVTPASTFIPTPQPRRDVGLFVTTVGVLLSLGGLIGIAAALLAMSPYVETTNGPVFDHGRAHERMVALVLSGFALVVGVLVVGFNGVNRRVGGGLEP
jgi:hypothetical protein